METKTDKNKPLKTLKTVGNVVFYVAILSVIIFGVIAVIGRLTGIGDGIGLFGYNAYVVGSNSMHAVNPDNFRKEDIKALGETQFDVGELILVKNLPDDYEIKDLDVVTFAHNGVIIVHRVVRITQDGDKIFYTTQGDANNVSDGERTRDEFKGVLVTSLGKGAGTFVSFMKSGFGIAAVFFSVAIIITASLVYDHVKKKDDKTEISAENDIGDKDTAPESETGETDERSSFDDAFKASNESKHASPAGAIIDSASNAQNAEENPDS